MLACAGLQYSAAPIEAWVVDAETKQPIEGVIVVAHWALESTSRIIPHQTNATGSLMILETVTDQNGRFHFPAWEPKWHLGSGDLTDDDPELIFFKSGYKYINVSNSQYTRPIKYRDEGRPVGAETKLTGAKRSSLWSGETIKMEKFGGTMEEYAKCMAMIGRRWMARGVRDYIHVSDLTNGHKKALEKLSQAAGVVTYNLGTGRGYSVLEMIVAFERVTSQPVPYRFVARRAGDTRAG